jgi:hypothetical protein
MPSRFNKSGDVSIWEVPEIDGVRQSLDRFREDELSDLWWKVIDRATEPGPMTALKEYSIATKMHELGCLDGRIVDALESGSEAYDTPTLVDDYRSALAQVTEITGIDADYIHRL